ncbi:alpha-glucuronidase [Microdochium trichocladiopsis]|uniref:Alpha-glucuronidase n=1 Tax=Microdochium trichocladiopsis TaxID=1682393 RepID=A0A9P8XSD3_9PEZI|nr:alpha-glucuronidase [Microdochium trichocladiopsis]KAH7014527.1 alpha-glucuronidase [Microdochium trichocladiopsis]
MATLFRFLILLLAPVFVVAETGIDAWLRYAPYPGAAGHKAFLPQTIFALNTTTTSPVYTAGTELALGLKSIYDLQASVEYQDALHYTTCPGKHLIVGTLSSYDAKAHGVRVPELIEDGYFLDITPRRVLIIGQNERGALYGAFEYLNRLGQGNVAPASFASNPDAPIRWVNQWDNMNEGGTHGSIERGYGGVSMFFWAGVVREDLTRVHQYARILASVGINGIVLNNVNANASLFNENNLDGLKRIADIFRPYGIRIGLSLLFSSPQSYGGLSTFDPLDERVIQWWHDITDKIYARVPDFAGYLSKASSEGQPGPLTYNRTLADGANLFARTVKPYGGIVLFRAFVYDSKTLNQTLDWKADRANAAVEFFEGLDTEFADNVVVQIKYGPIDFQVREPVSPLFSHLRQTPSAVELQVSQEYLGQQAHVVYLAPMWKETLDFDMRIDGKPSAVKNIINGQRWNTGRGGYAAVVNAGLNSTWLGSHLSLSNLYAYGKLAWDPESSAEELLDAWTRLTFSHDQAVVDTVREISMASWPAYEDYSGNLGVQTLTDILNGHYGPNPASQDGNPWGQWTRADGFSIGMDRTLKNGTGNAAQYPAEVAATYEDPETTPDNLLLWFHHLPYTYRLKSGSTVIQHFYDAHYRGSAVAQTFVTLWEGIKDKIDAQRYEEQLFRLVYQAGHSLVWRDSITNFYYNKSGIPDELGRVGNYKYRVEAEDMQLDGYVKYQVKPFESASRGWAIVTATNATQGTARYTLDKVETGKYDVAVNYFDQAIGNSTWTLYLGDETVGQWKGDFEYSVGKAATIYIDGQTAIRKTFKGVQVQKGVELKIVGRPDGKEPAPLDYISILPEGTAD